MTQIQQLQHLIVEYLSFPLMGGQQVQQALRLVQLPLRLVSVYVQDHHAGIVGNQVQGLVRQGMRLIEAPQFHLGQGEVTQQFGVQRVQQQRLLHIVDGFF